MFIFVQKYKILFNNQECLLCDDKQRVKTHTICQIFSQTANRIYSKYFHIKLISYVQNVEHRPRRGACIQTFAKVVNSFVDRCLRQVILDLLQCSF